MAIIKKVTISVMLVCFLGAVWALPATAIVLPDMPTLGVSPTPSDLIPTVDGVPVASQHDDFWSYSNQILRTIQKKDETFLPYETYGDYAFATGTGGLDVLLYTGADGQNNENVGPGGAFTFEDPEQNANDPSFNGVWGLGDNDNGPVTVGQTLDYLQAFDPNFNTPAFYMDMNQTGASSDFTFVGKVYLYDVGADGIYGTPDDGGEENTWAFDNSLQPGDGVYNFNAPIDPVASVVDLSPFYTGGLSTYDYGTVNHNKGSGKADYLAFAPTMDLSLYDRDLLFVTDFTISGLNDGFEEIFMTALGSKPIPEPSTFALLGAGLLVLGYSVRRKKK